MIKTIRDLGLAAGLLYASACATFSGSYFNKDEWKEGVVKVGDSLVATACEDGESSFSMDIARLDAHVMLAVYVGDVKRTKIENGDSRFESISVDAVVSGAKAIKYHRDGPSCVKMRLSF